MSFSRTEGSAATTIVDVTMPQMGVSVAEGTLVAWRVGVGDPIAVDETICEISTDKIDTEVPAPASGIVAEILVPVEATVPVGEVLARIAVGGSGGAHGASAAPTTAAGPGHTRTPSPTPVRTSTPNGAGTNGASVPAAAAAAATRGPSGRRYSPVVRRIAAEHGVDLSQVPGTGREGRVRKQDLVAFIETGGSRRRRSTSRARTGPSPRRRRRAWRPRRFRGCDARSAST